MTREWEEAVHRSSLDDLKQLAENGADINARDRHNRTALMLAATEGHTAVVEWLVRRGAALDHAAKYGLSALMLAVVRDHGEIVRVLADAGADVTLRGTGAPGFAGLAALDLAVAKNDREMIDVLAAAERRIGNPHFARATSWDAARALVTFIPRVPKATAGAARPALRVYVRDHKLRAVPVGERTLEAHYGRFVFTQSRRTPEELSVLRSTSRTGMRHRARLSSAGLRGSTNWARSLWPTMSTTVRRRSSRGTTARCSTCSRAAR